MSAFWPNDTPLSPIGNPSVSGIISGQMFDPNTPYIWTMVRRAFCSECDAVFSFALLMGYRSLGLGAAFSGVSRRSSRPCAKAFPRPHSSRPGPAPTASTPLATSSKTTVASGISVNISRMASSRQWTVRSARCVPSLLLSRFPETSPPFLTFVTFFRRATWWTLVRWSTSCPVMRVNSSRVLALGSGRGMPVGTGLDADERQPCRSAVSVRRILALGSGSRVPIGWTWSRQAASTTLFHKIVSLPKRALSKISVV